MVDVKAVLMLSALWLIEENGGTEEQQLAWPATHIILVEQEEWSAPRINFYMLSPTLPKTAAAPAKAITLANNTETHTSSIMVYYIEADPKARNGNHVK